MPTIPIDPTTETLQTFLGTIWTICKEEIGRPPDVTNPGDPVGAIMLNLALNGKTGAELRAWLQEQPEAVTHRTKPPEPPKPVRPTAIARTALPPFDRDAKDPDSGAALPVHTTLTQAVPPPGTLRWWRCNAWGVTVPGLPFVPGGATGPAQDRALSWFLDRWPPEWQDRILAAHGVRGYDRFVLSWPDSRGVGQSVQQYVDTTKRVRDAGLMPAHMLLSKVFDGENPDPATLDPLLEALVRENLIPLASVGWELNLFNSPQHLQPVIDHIAVRLGSNTALYLHFSPHYASWQPDRPGGSGADFWPLQVGKITGLLYQCVPNWSVGMMQARVNDVLVRLKAGGVWRLPQDFDVVPWETIATEQFENRADEDRGDLVGYELLCTPGPMPTMGFGNGGRYPDGRII